VNAWNHGHDVVNSTGGEEGSAVSITILIYEWGEVKKLGKICLNADFSFSLSLQHPTNRLENICVLLFALLQISSQENYYS